MGGHLDLLDLLRDCCRPGADEKGLVSFEMGKPYLVWILSPGGMKLLGIETDEERGISSFIKSVKEGMKVLILQLQKEIYAHEMWHLY